jgi:hypothetical protein
MANPKDCLSLHYFALHGDRETDFYRETNAPFDSLSIREQTLNRRLFVTQKIDLTTIQTLKLISSLLKITDHFLPHSGLGGPHYFVVPADAKVLIGRRYAAPSACLPPATWVRVPDRKQH